MQREIWNEDERCARLRRGCQEVWASPQGSRPQGHPSAAGPAVSQSHMQADTLGPRQPAGLSRAREATHWQTTTPGNSPCPQQSELNERARQLGCPRRFTASKGFGTGSNKPASSNERCAEDNAGRGHLSIYSCFPPSRDCPRFSLYFRTARFVFSVSARSGCARSRSASTQRPQNSTSAASFCSCLCSGCKSALFRELGATAAPTPQL